MFKKIKYFITIYNFKAHLLKKSKHNKFQHKIPDHPKNYF